MHPLLFQIGPLSIRTYGAMVALAFIVALRMAGWGARLRNIPEVFMVDVSAVAILSGLLGARLFYILQNISYFRDHPGEIFKLWQGGLVFFGGFLVASIITTWYVHRQRMPIAAVADCAAPALVLAQAIGRWGCFFAGCCYGRPTAVPWALRFKDSAALAPLGIELHPVQIYESFGCLLIGLFLWVRLVRRKDADGQVFWFYVLLYGLLRFVMEIFRGDDRGPTLGGLSQAQIIAILAVVIAGSILVAQKTASARSHDAHA